MLRITTTNGCQDTRTLKLEGKLLGPWIGELESSLPQVPGLAGLRSPGPGRPVVRRCGGGSVPGVFDP